MGYKQVHVKLSESQINKLIHFLEVKSVRLRLYPNHLHSVGPGSHILLFTEKELARFEDGKPHYITFI